MGRPRGWRYDATKHHIDDLQRLDVEVLLAIAEERARSLYSGHLTILRFTTDWKVMFGTPNLLSDEAYAEVLEVESFDTLKEALIHLLSDSNPPLNQDFRERAHAKFHESLSSD